MIRSRGGHSGFNPSLFSRQLLHLARKNIRFIGVVLILLTVLLNITHKNQNNNDHLNFLESEYLNGGTLPSRLRPQDTLIGVSDSIQNNELNTKNDTEILKEEKTLKEKILAERLKSGYKKYPRNTTQGAMVESLSNEGYKPKACLLMTLFKPTGDRVDPEAIYLTVSSIQKKFNNWFEYPWVFISKDGHEYMNNEFTEQIKELVPESIELNFETVTNEYLHDVPEWIDVNKISDSQIRLSGIEYGDSQFFRSLNRYLVGYLWKEPFLGNFDWYWRIEPGLELLCDIDYDLFRWMQDRNQVFGFALSYMEPHKEVVEKLWDIFKKFANEFKNKKEIVDFEKNNFQFNTEFKDLPKEKDEKKRKKLEEEAAKHGIGTGSSEYNKCQYVSSFQLANLNFFRSQPFMDLFERLDKEGGFYYHRWSASSVHTMAINLLLRKNQLYFFDNIGFKLSTDSMASSSQFSSISRNFYNCPIDDATYREYNCNCDQGLDFTFMKDSCTAKFYDSTNRKKPDDWDKH
ncbi:similar to Saccharomyces cerevisiae YDR483W KRE2 Alpha1,2- mannosyltransferase of the Golgi involved in protein mannosylation [Maudiozyma barnettii]|uniref:Similar to Saccharomyces cerevisiae YDR483W KRE2 Alpha1,2- mannosyltransferase of the Golgi involved in protein mannosylation n=1 Tax=Maudiozyma barnettii TaxID=61262 RepID=A0A8H2VI44_9SACH|nr:uncharacterized protein KABA2_07S05324 [Kazachstania barnettii]CAB4255825.1 similar to Saccharomyces cerevisiae YDR483W KRE2 Alpha1,2- mannosyltransferase of the Golgi involved in protein mannosylation [Kazachstania barnettii]CAD1784386.1 similar to Saccharomyces cerevisiae YDR483W KRE2 Alpha1,2- mannosyltransferase of the Golgi involved in protein mannosylation [Kazachstania barnettii]